MLLTDTQIMPAAGCNIVGLSLFVTPTDPIQLFDNSPLSGKISFHAGVAELADALRSGRSEHSARESSNLSFGTRDLLYWRSFFSPKRNYELSPQWYNICNKGCHV